MIGKLRKHMRPSIIVLGLVLSPGVGKAQVELPVTAGQILALAQGYAPHRAELLAGCVQGEPAFKGVTRATYGLDQPAIDTELNAALYPSLSLLSFGNEVRSSPGDYVAGLLPGRRTIRLSYVVFLGGRSAELAEPSLSSLGRKLKDSGSAKERLATCGDLYVRKVELGGHFVVSANISFLSADDRRMVWESGVLQHTGLDDLADELGDLGERYKDKLKISLDISQLGGDISAFYRMVQSLEAQGWLSCAYPKINRCARGIQTIYRYATAPDELYSQFDRPLSKENLASFAVSRAILAPLNTVSPGFTDPVPAYGRELAQLDRLIRQVIDKKAFIAELGAWHDLGDSRLNPRGSLRLTAALQHNVSQISDAVAKCRRHIASCGSFAAEADAHLVDEPIAAGFFPKSFVDVCLAEERSLSDRIILEAVAQRENVGSQEQCYGLLTKMQDTLRVNLTGLGIQDASLLYQFDQLQRLELARNLLGNLAADDYWPDLNLLDLAHNRLRQVRLNPTMPLAKLYLEGNRLPSLDDRTVPSGIVLLALYDNPLDDIQKTKEQLKAKARHLLVTPLELCALHGRKLLPLGHYSQETLEEQLVAGNGPDYANIAGTTRFKGWRPCASIYLDYPKI